MPERADIIAWDTAMIVGSEDHIAFMTEQQLVNMHCRRVFTTSVRQEIRGNENASDARLIFGPLSG